MNHIYELPQFGENWFSYQNLYSKFVKELPDESKIVEVGCWKGKSVAYLAVEIINSNKKIKIDAVDTWDGTLNEEYHQQDTYVRDNKLYDLFLSNIEPVKNVVNPIRMDSVSAAELYEDESLDVVFIDAAHDYENVRNDVLAWYPKVKPNGYIAGHDYYHPPVKAAVDEVLSDKGVIHYSVIEGCWCLRKNNEPNVKRYQLHMFYNELDLLEVQLEENFNYVDKFIIVESNKTHAGNEKELFFLNNAKRFEKYKDKIIHLVCDFDSDLYKDYCNSHTGAFHSKTEPWKREHFQRDYPLLCGKIDFNDDDILIVSDVDEIINPRTVSEFLNNNRFFKDPLRIEMYFMHYYMNTNVYHEDSGIDKRWYSPFVVRFADIKNYENSLSIIRVDRYSENQPVIKNGGWHFSYMFDVNGILNKIKNFAHCNDEFVNYMDYNKVQESIKNLNIFYYNDSNTKLRQFPKKLLPLTVQNNLNRWNAFFQQEYTLSNKKSLVIIGAYPNTENGINVLKKTILSLKEDFDILLSTHYPVDKDIQQMVKYYVYDHRNEMIPHKHPSYTWWTGNPNFYIQKEEKQASPNYHYAVYRLIMNGLSLVKDYYEDFYYIESDCVFDKSDIEKLKNMKKDSLESNKQACYFGNTEFFYTLLFWSKIDYFLKVIPLFKTPEEFIKATDGNNCIENFIPYSIIHNDSVSNINLLFDVAPSKHFNRSKLAQLTLKEGNTVNFQCKTAIVKDYNSNNIFFIFSSDVNSSTTEINIKIDGVPFVLTNGEYVTFKQITPSSDTIVVEVNGHTTKYIVNEVLNDNNSYIRFSK